MSSVPLIAWTTFPDMVTSRLLTIFFLLPMILLTCPGYCRAIGSEESDSITAELLQMIWSLLLVIAVILLLYALLRKKFSLIGAQGDKAIKIVEMRPLPGRKSLCLVEVENKKLLLGIAEESINVLTSFPDVKSFESTLEGYKHQGSGEKSPEQEITP